MISLHASNIDFQQALDLHVKYLSKKIKSKIKSNASDSRAISMLKAFIERNLNSILTAYPDELIKLNNKFIFDVNSLKLFSSVDYDKYIQFSKSVKRKAEYKDIYDFFNELNKLLSYYSFLSDSNYNSYNLTHNLNIRSCIYCNRIYTLTTRKVSKKKLMNPQLDHWFPKSKYPLLQLSFFNLIPSCDICNSRIKRNNIFSLEKHFHPYFIEDINENLEFTFYFKNLNEYQVLFSENSSKKIKSTYELMHIDEMYTAHQYELKDLIKIKTNYSSNYIDILTKTFPKADLSKNDIYRLAMGTEAEPKDFHQRPFSKFKYDIWNELKKY